MNATDLKTRPKILYIEDTPDSRALIRRLLGDDYIFLEAGNPLDGIELALDTQPDLILLDLNLPDMSGYEVATRFTTLLPDTPLVALTADASVAARERALIAGCVGFLTKPIDIDLFFDQLTGFLGGERETLNDSAISAHEYQAYLVEHLESKVRELSSQIERNAHLNQQNGHVIGQLRRRQRFMEATARVSQSITSILELSPLLRQTVEIICREFDLYFAGIFLRENDQTASLRAGFSPDQAHFRQADYTIVLDNQMDPIGTCITSAEPVLIENNQESGYGLPERLQDTRALFAMPLIFNQTTQGALVVHSRYPDAFGQANLTALRGLADQVSVAIRNTELLDELETATAELIRSRTLEAIATASGEAIHWVGNRAAPIAGSVTRLRADLDELLAIVAVVINIPDHAWGALLAQRLAELDANHLRQTVQKLNQTEVRKLRQRGRPKSMLEDLAIISESAATILEIKEGLLGPARHLDLGHVDLVKICEQAAATADMPRTALSFSSSQKEMPAWSDAIQLERVLLNLLKNAWEALAEDPAAHIELTIGRQDPDWSLLVVSDNGPGIPEAVKDKIWISFFTTKGDRGGTGLGLAACLSIINQLGGQIWAESPPGKGASFFIRLPNNPQPANATEHNIDPETDHGPRS